jgi:hypothetical protein
VSIDIEHWSPDRFIPYARNSRTLAALFCFASGQAKALTITGSVETKFLFSGKPGFDSQRAFGSQDLV